MSQSHVHDFESALYTEFQVAEPRELFNEFTRVWNKCASIPGWPMLLIARNVMWRKCVVDWGQHTRLKVAIEQYLARGRKLGELEQDGATDEDVVHDDQDVVMPLAAATARWHRGALGMVVWALLKGGISPMNW